MSPDIGYLIIGISMFLIIGASVKLYADDLKKHGRTYQDDDII